MRFDHAAITLEPLTIGNTLDVALLFLRRHLGAILSLMLLFAVPLCGLVWWLSEVYLFDVRLAIVVFFWGTSPLGVFLIAGSARGAFGEPFTMRDLFRRVNRKLMRMLGTGLLARLGIGVVLAMFYVDWYLAIRVLLGMLLFAFPGIWLAIRTGFSVEREMFRELSHHLQDRRVGTLIKTQFSGLLGRGLIVILFCVVVWWTLLITCDTAINLLCGIPILLGRVHTQFDLGLLLQRDPVVITLLLFTAFLVYPFGRLAWFFCYIDLRVRQDCWDMELKLIHEAERLEGVS